MFDSTTLILTVLNSNEERVWPAGPDNYEKSPEKLIGRSFQRREVFQNNAATNLIALKVLLALTFKVVSGFYVACCELKKRFEA